MQIGSVRVRWSGCVLSILWLLTGCAAPEKDRSRVLGSAPVTAAQMGSAWPLTVDHGELICEGYLAAVFRTDGVDYALNGAAVRQGYADISVLLKKGRNSNGLLQTTLRLCV